MRLRTKLLLAGAALALVVGSLLAWEVRQLPSVDELPRRLAARYAAAPHTAWVPLWAISPRLQTAVVVWEDPTFYHHSGVSLGGIRRAVVENVRTGAYTRGGSTLTQQVAKNLFLTKEKTWRRKFDETILAWRLEQRLSKNQILEIYLNIAEWSGGTVGAEAASRLYFGKPAADLSWAEAALLAGILPNPHRNNPLVDPASALRLRHRVLEKLLEEGALTPQEFDQAEASPLLPAPSPASRQQ